VRPPKVGTRRLRRAPPRLPSMRHTSDSCRVVFDEPVFTTLGGEMVVAANRNPAGDAALS